jgi:putative ABC transport system permease protein
MRHVKQAIRLVRTQPTLTAVVTLTMVLCIGANASVFSVVDRVLVAPLPYPNSGRLVAIEDRHAMNVTYGAFLDLEAHAATVEHVAAIRPWQFNLTGGRAEPERIDGAHVSNQFFAALGSAPALGRGFDRGEDAAGAPPVAVIGYGIWQTRFGGGAAVLTQSLKLNGVDYRIIGVMPRGFSFPAGAALWVPLAARGPLGTNRRSHLLKVIASRRGDAPLAAVREELRSLGAAIVAEHRGQDDRLSFSATPLQERLTKDVRPALLVLWGAVGFVLLIATVNVSHLLLERSMYRSREVAIRIALGASKIAVARWLLADSVLLTMVGGAGGVVLASALVRAIAAVAPKEVTAFGPFAVDARVLAASMLLAAAAGCVATVAPVLSANVLAPAQTLGRAGRGHTLGETSVFVRVLVGAEVALALTLFAGAALLVTSLIRLQRVTPGFDASGVLTLDLFIATPGGQELTPSRVRNLLDPALLRIRQLPGVEAAGLINVVPGAGGPSTDFEIDRQPKDAAEEPTANVAIADAGYFGTLRIPLLRGRLLRDDDTEHRPRAVVISESFAQRYWRGVDPIGQRITMKDWGPPVSAEIVGIVGDVRSRGLDAPPPSIVYWSYQQFPSSFNALVVKVHGEPAASVAAVKNALWSVDPNQAVARAATLESLEQAALAPRRFTMLLLTAFAGVALLLAAGGIYGVMAYAVSRRRAEMGVRLALGATPINLFSLTLWSAAKVAGGGIVAGVAFTSALTRTLGSLLFDVSPTDPRVLGAAVVVCCSVCVIAGVVPAWTAASSDPLETIRGGQ